MRLRALFLLVFLAPALPLAAQIDSALLSKISFNLTNPGGKSLAMGGAFTAIADDATAGLANPAGLGLLSSIEAGVSGKGTSDVLGLVTARSNASGPLLTPYPAVKGSRTDVDAKTRSFEFGGVVIPISQRFVAEVSFAENLRFEGATEAGGYPYIELRDNRTGGSIRNDFLYEYREYGGVSLRNKVFGASVGYRVSERLRVGAGITLSKLAFELTGDAAGPHRIVSRTFISLVAVETREVRMAVSDVDSSVPGFVLGVHADLLPRGLLTFGASYRASGRARGTFTLDGAVPPALESQRVREFAFRVPRDASVGLATQPLPGLTIAVEGQWIEYSGLFDKALPVVSYAGLVGPSPGFPVSGILAEIEPARDILIPRAGAEYVAASDPLRLAFRVGWHREPAHGVRANVVARDGQGVAFDLHDPPFSAASRTIFDGGRADDRFSGGLGVTYDGRLSLDLAFDVGRTSRTLAASLFYRF
ncbi:MAG: hypothetical protein JNK60_23380 [Acidobacteria bacterium]|nr:hypothetical protein [Acidobacteriota bacterium]